MDHRAEERVAVEQHFDEMGEREWDRLAVDVRARVSFEIHRRFLARQVESGMRVLEIGAGPGRFTIALAELGCRVVVADISSVQLQLNAQHVRDADAEEAVEDRVQLDICDLSRFSDGAFDAVVAYGGPLSYVFESASDALVECLRVTRPAGVVLGSVMSLVGSARHFIAAFLPDIEIVGIDAVNRFLEHGDQRSLEGTDAHGCRLFSWADLQQAVGASGGRIIAGSASNWLSLGPIDTIEQFESDPGLWSHFLDWEVRFCAEPGALDGGTHLLFAAEGTRS